MTASSLIERVLRLKPPAPASEPAAAPSSAATAAILRAAELGAEAGEAGFALDAAVVRVDADVRRVASEIFAVAPIEGIDAAEALLNDQLRAEKVIVRHTDGRPAMATDVAWTFARTARVGVALISGIGTTGITLQALGLITTTGWMLLVGGSLAISAAGPEVARVACRAKAAFAAWRTVHRARARVAALQEQLRDVARRRVAHEDTTRCRDDWAANTTELALAELRLQHQRGTHARAIVN